jgi:hypothetical protein
MKNLEQLCARDRHFAAEVAKGWKKGRAWMQIDDHGNRVMSGPGEFSAVHREWLHHRYVQARQKFVKEGCHPPEYLFRAIV